MQEHDRSYRQQRLESVDRETLLNLDPVSVVVLEQRQPAHPTETTESEFVGILSFEFDDIEITETVAI